MNENTIRRDIDKGFTDSFIAACRGCPIEAVAAVRRDLRVARKKTQRTKATKKYDKRIKTIKQSWARKAILTLFDEFIMVADIAKRLNLPVKLVDAVCRRHRVSEGSKQYRGYW